ncbi:bone morphogenetic protein 8B-like isoform X2 [Acomys russatus]|uniref:bone morphogenetic protein 8B-like isoform X2 n=1 Tax=Acomys russatus TaxID=60746 RepID=UPI0021E1FEEF|nr:bone morphogenetic protein 8B-like isoform X2 [Acomys russatus]
MATGPRLLWLFGLVLCPLSGGHLPRPPHVFPQRRLGVHQRRDMQREILAVLGLPGRARPRAPPAPAREPASAPLFMLDLYHAMADGSGGGQPQPHLHRADLVMSFVNMVERDRTLGYQEPHWKEFRFDLSQIPDGEAVTAAEFRIYKEPSPHPLNTTLHVSMFEVVQEHSSRESDLFFLDLQTLRSGDEGWLVLDITAASDRWLLNQNKDLGLRLYVETKDGHSLDPGLAGLLGQHAPHSRQPFMVGFFRASWNTVRAPRGAQPLNKQQLNKINLGIFDDGHGSRGREVCRRHELYVSFRDLGWLDWVIAPQGYSAYYCDGECIYPLNSCLKSTNHATMQALVHLMKPDVVPKVCCVPTELSPISLLYYDRNNNVILRRKHNMVVQACGCH